MANIAIFRINYKSDFILTLNSDAGWMTPFCIKFWTGAPSQAYFAGYDGTNYTNCAPVDGEPTKLLVQFDDHHLPIGDLKFQIGYHFTVDDFPTSVEDEVINQAAVIIDQDGTPMQVMLDLNGETAPAIQFSLPAYANEQQRIANEEQRIAAEAIRIVNEESRIAAETIRQQNEAQRIAQETARVNEFAVLKRESEQATTDANNAAENARQKAQLAQDKATLAQTAAQLANDKAALAQAAAQLANDKAALAQAAAQLANDKAQLAADKAALAQAASQLCDEKAALAQQKATYAQQQGDYSKAQGDYAKEQGDYSKAQGDYSKEQGDYSKEQGDYAKDKGDICAADHQTAVADHQTATDDHQTAAADHQTATTDHNQAGNDHTRAESDHNRAESDHAAVELYVDSLGVFDLSKHNAVGGVLATYADLDAALTALNALDSKYKYGGMSFKFVHSVDNKYVQFRCMANEFTTDVAYWQGVDDEPTVGSDNLVKSGGVFKDIQNSPGIIAATATADYLFEDKEYNIPSGYYIKNLGVKVGLYAEKVTTSTSYISLDSNAVKIAPFDLHFIRHRNEAGPIKLLLFQDADYAEFVKKSVLDDSISNVNGVIQELSDELHNSIDWDGLSISYIKEVDVSGNLFKIAKKIGEDGYYIVRVNSDGTLAFNPGAAGYRSYLIPVDGVSTYNFTYGRFVVLMKDETHAVDGASVQTYTNSVSSVGAKYIAFSFNSSDFPEETYQVSVGTLQAEPVFKIPYLKVNTGNLEDLSVNTGKLKDKAVTFDKIGFSVLGNNLFNINDPDNVIGKYIMGNTLNSGDGSYNTTGYIPVEPNTTYQCSSDGDMRFMVYLARYVCQYGSDKSYISGVDLQPDPHYNRFTTGASTYFIRVSAKGAYWNKYQIEKGSTPTAWKPYKHIIDPQYLPKESFYHFEGSTTLAQNETLTLPQSYSRRNLAFSALIDGTDNANLDVLIGLGYNKFRGAWLELTPTKVIVHEYTTSDSTTEYIHGLTLGSSTVMSFDAGTTEATIKVISDGNVFSQSIDRGFFFGGAGFVTNKGSNSIDARLSVMLKDVTKKVWLFGDSYLSWNDSARWLYWMLQWGFESWMSDSLPGGGSDVGYVSFGNDIKIGKPVYLLWANGMNDAADANVNTPNATWLGYVNNVVSTCEEKGITPVLATIPSVPSKLHDGKNKWVRESGYRYVDFAAAVGATSAGVWKTGMLSSDNIHPTTLGAKALASQVLIDFPEIMVK